MLTSHSSIKNQKPVQIVDLDSNTPLTRWQLVQPCLVSEIIKTAPSNFIRTIIEEDQKNGKHDGRLVTRFPPEPNGYLHIGHAKSICLNFGLAAQYNGTCHLRFDDTNPEKEEHEYVKAIQEDVRWLGFDWADNEYYTSDYFQKLYDFAIQLIKDGKAYVESLTADEIREYRGTLKTSGKNSPWRDRPVQENLDLFERMKNGEFRDGEYVVRARIDMASPNMNMRDPTIYRIRHATHQKTGDAWCVFPMYDFAHCISDAIEGITHSLCTMEFEDHRPLYDWVLDQLKTRYHPQQIEFARLNLGNTVLSKRKLKILVDQNHVDGWDDPRMPTISGMRRRGYTSASIRNFVEAAGIAKAESTVDFAMLEFFVREDLNKMAHRRMVVQNPLKLIIKNWPEGQVEQMEAKNNPEDESAGVREIPFGRELWIEREDFREQAPRKFHRLTPGKEVRLQHAFYVKCIDFKKDEHGEITEVICTYDPDTRGGWSRDGRKVKGTSHWVSAAHAIEIKVRQYELLFKKENPEKLEEGQKDFTSNLNPDSVKEIIAFGEPSLEDVEFGQCLQFLRQGYFCVDNDKNDGSVVFNRTVSLRDSWAKIEKENIGKNKNK